MACPNTNLESWKNLVIARGEDTAYYLWDKYDGNVPESESNSSIVKAGLKSVAALQSDKATSLFNALEKNKVTGDAFWNKLQSDLQIPKEQIELLKQYNTTNREELITNMLADYSFAIEINIAKTSKKDYNDDLGANFGKFEYNGYRYYQVFSAPEYNPDETGDGIHYKVKIGDNNPIGILKKEYEDAFNNGKETPSQYYSNLTVPGGTNYTENEIATPAITPSIKGHAQFATDKGIGWFRSDDKLSEDVQGDVDYQTYGVESGIAGEEIPGTRTTRIAPKDKFTYAGDEYEKKEPLFDEEDYGKISYFKNGKAITSNEFYSTFDAVNQPTKTRRILEVQSDLFQKGRDKEDLISKKSNFTINGYTYIAENGEYLKAPINSNSYINVSKEEYFKSLESFEKTEPNKKITTDNQFLQLLNKANNWVTFFVKSIIQDSAKKGYEKVVFPTGATAYKIESGGDTIEDFIKNKEDRIKKLEEGLKTEPVRENGKYVLYGMDDETGEDLVEEFDTLKEAEEFQRRNSGWLFKNEEVGFSGRGKNISEIEQLKREIEDAKRGASGLAATAKFYQETVANVLKKQGYSPKQVTDEYGNTWNEIEIVPEREQGKILFQLEGMPASKASQETLNIMRAAAEKMGIKLEDLAEYAKKTGLDIKGITGVADFVKGVVAIANGRADVALTEEVVHMATAIIEQTNPKMITEMLSKIDRFQIYKKTLEEYRNNKNYQLPDGKPDIRKIKKEAVDKLIAEVIINKNDGSTEFPELMAEENQSLIKKWWNAILDFIRGIYKSSNIDVFETAAEQVAKGEVGGTAENITAKGIMLQVEKNQAVDDYYNKCIETASKLKLNPAVGTEKRHYTFDGQRVAATVTEKIKGDSKMPERTGLDKMIDDQMRDWGTNGHTFLDEYISTNLIDDQGYAKATPSDTPIKSSFDSKIESKLKEYAKQLIASYPKGTRFLIETKVVNAKVKGMLASTVDFKAIVPVEKADGTKTFKIDNFDWKFTSINKEKTEDIPWFKKKEWGAQMGEYVKMDYSYGAKQENMRLARMIPFILNYSYVKSGDRASGVFPSSIEIGKVDSKTETNLYLLPVPVVSESTGNKEVDKLLQSLRNEYENLYSKPVAPGEKSAKYRRLNELSKAIRVLHLKLDFEPLRLVGANFLKSAEKSIKSLDGLDYTTLDKAGIEEKMKELIEIQKSAVKYGSLDKTLISYVSRENMSDEEKKTLTALELLGASTGRMLNELQRLQKDFVVQYALKQGITTEKTKLSILEAEREVNALAKSFIEASKLDSKIINLAANMLMNAQSEVSMSIAKLAKEYGPKLLALEKEAAAQGKSAFDMIGEQSSTLRLIRKIDKKFWTAFEEAKKSKDRQFFLNNMDLARYNELAQKELQSQIDEINNSVFSTIPDDNESMKKARIEKAKNTFNIESDKFAGFEDYDFSRLFRETMLESKHYSPEFIQMSRNKAALDMWTFMTALNERARAAGMLDDTNSFFPLMEASLLQKLSQSSDGTVDVLKDFFRDQYTVRINEEQTYSRLDPETGKVKKQVPKLFTRTDKDVTKLSKDLNRVLSLWTRALLQYESSRQMENTLLTLHSVEKAKGHIVMEGKNIIFEGGVPKVELSSNKNAELLETIIDDGIYGIQENLNSMGNVVMDVAVGKLKKGTEEEKQQKVLKTKKFFQTSNLLTQSLAVGLKSLVAIPNYMGYHFQQFINAGNFYKSREFEKNHLRILTNQISTIDKAMMHVLVPLNEDVAKQEMRDIAWKQGTMKWIGTWTFQDVMMSTNAFPEKLLQLTNAKTMNDNSMVVDGKIVNIRQYLKAKDRETKYKMSESERKALEKTFESRVKELKETKALSKIARIENDELVIPGVDNSELARYRTSIVEYSRNLNGQMSQSNKADYRRDTLFKSFMMFKNWIPKQVMLRTLDIKKNPELGQWEYGRARAFVKTWAHLGLTGIFRMRDVMLGTEKGLAIMDEILEEKRQAHLKSTGQELEITNEEFYDMMRKELSSQMKELGLLISLIGLIIAAKIAAPKKDEDLYTKNQYKYWAKAINKISDEIAFYYNPASFESITRGSVLPQLGLLIKSEQIINHVSKQTYGWATDDEATQKNAHPTKYILDVLPVASQFEREILPLIDPEMAKELGIRVTSQARAQQ